MPRDNADIPRESLRELITEALTANGESWDDVVLLNLMHNDAFIDDIDERKKLLNKQYALGTIGYKQMRCTLWTKTNVYFLHNTRGDGYIMWVPRNPNPELCVRSIDEI